MKKIAGKYIDIKYDILRAVFISAFVTTIWLLVAYFNETIDMVNDKYIVFIGGVVALSGLLFRQYMIKEVVDYLSSCNKLMVCVDKVINLSKNDIKINYELKESMNQVASDITEYISYVKLELKIVPAIPLLLILFYGCSMLSCGIFRYFTLYFMLLLVSYLGVVSVSSANIATSIVDMNRNVDEYNDIIKLLSRE